MGGLGSVAVLVLARDASLALLLGGHDATLAPRRRHGLRLRRGLQRSQPRARDCTHVAPRERLVRVWVWVSAALTLTLSLTLTLTLTLTLSLSLTLALALALALALTLASFFFFFFSTTSGDATTLGRQW